ncbi:MAG: hypothetical protein IKH63_05225 [Prevotella sp.]|nr:hypothetical protein [Prevotella sp.]
MKKHLSFAIHSICFICLNLHETENERSGCRTFAISEKHSEGEEDGQVRIVCGTLQVTN